MSLVIAVGWVHDFYKVTTGGKFCHKIIARSLVENIMLYFKAF